MAPGLRSVLAVAVTAALALLLAGALAACGEDEGSSQQTTTGTDGGSGQTTATARGGRVQISADPGGGTTFVENAAEARAGEVRFQFRNPSDEVHSLCVESEEDGPLGCTSQFRRDSSELRLTLERGEHVFYCNVEGHRDAGMQGTLTVR